MGNVFFFFCSCLDIQFVNEKLIKGIIKVVFFCCFFSRVVGGFEALTAMENVESDPKTDKPKVLYSLMV